MSTNVAGPPSQIIVQQPPSMFGRFGKLLATALVIAILHHHQLVWQLSQLLRIGRSAERAVSLALENRDEENRDHRRPRRDHRERRLRQEANRSREGRSGRGRRRAADRFAGRHGRPAATISITICDKLAEERKLPIVVSMGGICASGGYYIAMSVGDQKDAIFAEPTTWTGSIGVIIPHYDLSGLLHRYDVADDSVASGPLKQMGSPTKPMTPEDRKLLQTLGRRHASPASSKSWRAAGLSLRTIRRRSMRWRRGRFSRPSRRSTKGWSTSSDSSRMRSPAMRRIGERCDRSGAVREIRAADRRSSAS